MLLQILITVLFSKASVGIIYDSYTSEPASDELIERYTSLNILQNCTNDIELPCKDDEPRRLDGSCNNAKFPAYGTFHTPLIRLLPPIFSNGTEPRLAASGDPLPLERQVRTRMLMEGKGSDDTYTQLMTYMNAMCFADVGSVHDTMNYLQETTTCCTSEGKDNSMCAPIEVPIDDPVHRFSGIRCLNLTKPKSFQTFGCAQNTGLDRIAFNTPTYDLSYVYRSVVPVPEYRAGKGGLLLVEEEDGSVWPWSQGPHNVTSCLANVRENGETRCWGVVQGSIPPVTMGTLWFYRLHNIVAAKLAEVNPQWSDDELFYTARKICIAINNQMTYYELLPQTIGEEYCHKYGLISNSTGFRDNYDDSIKPQASFDYMYVLRWFHTVQEGHIKMYDEDNCYLKEEPIGNHTLRVGFLSMNDNAAKMTRGIFLQPCGRVDNAVDPEISESGLGGMQRASDLTTADMRKGRLFGVQSYVNYLEYFGSEKLKTWGELTKYISQERIDQMKQIYPTIFEIDALVGMWAEKQLKGAFVTPSVADIMGDQMRRAMVMDKNWHEREGIFTSDQLQELRRSNYATFLCTVEPKLKTIPQNPLRRVSDTNPMVTCDEIPKWDFSAWKE